MSGILLGVLAYIAVQFAVAILVSRRIKSETDYILGGRQLGMGLAAFSVFATWFGAETVLGSAGRVYSDGMSGAQGEPFAYAVAIVIMGVLFAARLWRRGLVTFGDMFRERFSPGVERLTVILLVPGSVLWAAAQIRGFGQIMGTTTGMDLTAAITLAAVIVVLYTAVGGLLADVYSDFVQGIAIVIGLVAMLVVIVIGGSAVRARRWPTSRLARFAPIKSDQSLLDFLEQWAIPICGSLVAVELISRVLACKSADVARTATWLGGVGYLLVALIPVFLGLVGAQLAPGLEEAEQIVPTLAQKYLPAVLYVMFAGALISAILSTVDSALLASASLVSHNIVLRLWPGATEERQDRGCARRCGRVRIGRIRAGAPVRRHLEPGGACLGLRQRRHLCDRSCLASLRAGAVPPSAYAAIVAGAACGLVANIALESAGAVRVWRDCRSGRLPRLSQCWHAFFDRAALGGVAIQGQALADRPQLLRMTAQFAFRPMKSAMLCGPDTPAVPMRPCVPTYRNFRFQRRFEAPKALCLSMPTEACGDCLSVQAEAVRTDEKVKQGHWHGTKRGLKRRRYHGPCVGGVAI